MDSISILSKKSVVLIFAYSPAGFGHLRVTDALYHGLPESVSPVLLGSQDKTIRYIHRFTSIHPFARLLFEWLQARIFPTIIYRFSLRHRTRLLEEQLKTILDERLDVADTVVLVATHFGLAHQLAAIKNKISHEKKVTIYLFVQVTDDSPQPIWYIDGANIIFVPSYQTKKDLEEYGKHARLRPTELQVVAYPISPSLIERLTDKQHIDRLAQMDPKRSQQIHVSIPISGAAVGTNFLKELLITLREQSDRFCFHITAKNVPYTKDFIQHIQRRPYVHISLSNHDREVVNRYEELFMNTVISLEVTKPSEQTFKVLCSPKTRGGVILLFAAPVGQQERDNLHFLRRHELLPSEKQQTALLEGLKQNSEIDNSLLKSARSWRGLILPEEPIIAANFILWCLRQGVFSEMMRYPLSQTELEKHRELSPHGVSQFWHQIGAFLEEHTE